MAKQKNNFMVCQDHQRRTCIKVSDDDHMIRFIPLDITNGFQVQETSKASFISRFKPLPNYSVSHACQLYFNYCKAVGATTEVLDHLEQYIVVTKSDREMITAKRQGLDATAPAKVTKSKTSSPKTTKPKKVDNASGYSSAAKMFRALIMDGKLTDDEIFKQVQKAFGLDDNRRSYVKWYRKQLTDQGKNPPETR